MVSHRSRFDGRHYGGIANFARQCIYEFTYTLMDYLQRQKLNDIEFVLQPEKDLNELAVKEYKRTSKRNQAYFEGLKRGILH
jgi:hypothetical protein